MPEPCKIKELKGKTYRCYFELTLSVIGGKWKPIILNHLALEQIMRFGELTRSIPEITQRMLTKQLRELEADGLVHREVYREVPPRVEYSLTALGYTIIPILQHMRQWGVDYEKHLGGEGLFEDEGFECAEPPELLAL